MSKHLWKKVYNGGRFCLAPACRDAELWIGKMAVGACAMIDPKKPRNLDHHRKLFALLGLAVDNWPVDVTTDSLLGLIKIKTGHTTPIKSADGTIYHIPKSSNFESMGQTEFDPFYEKAVQLIALALGVTPDELETARLDQ